jgi:hypothetical protein
MRRDLEGVRTVGGRAKRIAAENQEAGWVPPVVLTDPFKTASMPAVHSAPLDRVARIGGGASNKKSSTPDTGIEDCTQLLDPQKLRSPRPPRSGVYGATLQAGLLTHGSSYSPGLPTLSSSGLIGSRLPRP